MALIRVTAEQLKAKADELTELNNSLKNNVSELEACEQNLLTMWDGEAKDAFHREFNNDRIQMSNFSTLIEKYVYTLLQITQKYIEAERMNVDTANTRK